MATLMGVCVPLSWGTHPSPGNHFLTVGEGPGWSHVCFSPSEFRSRQTPAGTCSSSLFPPLEGSGSLAAFPSEPVPGTNPGILMGAQQAGEAVQERPRCQGQAWRVSASRGVQRSAR